MKSTRGHELAATAPGSRAALGLANTALMLEHGQIVWHGECRVLVTEPEILNRLLDVTLSEGGQGVMPDALPVPVTAPG